MAQSEIYDLSETDSSNTSISTYSVDGNVANMSTTDNVFQSVLGLLARWAGDDTLVAAATTNFGSVPGQYIVITGNTGITAGGTIKAGTVKFLKFTGAPLLTHNATSFILPGGANIQAAAGDTAIFVSEGSGNWRCIGYQRASGGAAIDPYSPGHLFGATLSNNVTDATNDIDIAAGSARDSTDAANIVLSAAITKRLDAAWAVGTGNGGLDTGAIANTTYHLYLIKRVDTGVVDVIFSTSASAPTLPANYTLYRRIGSIIRSAGAIRQFYQFGDRFMYRTGIADRSDTAAFVAGAFDLSVPQGIVTRPIFSQSQLCSGAGVQVTTWGDVVGGTATAPASTITRLNGEQAYALVDGSLIANTLGRLLLTVTITSGTLSANVTTTYGWYDNRGRDAA